MHGKTVSIWFELFSPEKTPTTKYKPNLTRENSSKKWRNLITTLMLIMVILMICKKDLYSPLDLACHQLPEQIN